jgi:hypothetical protein
MKRWYLADVYFVEDPEFGYWRSAIQAYPDTPFEFHSVPPDMNTGNPLYPWTLALLDVDEQATVENDAQIHALPLTNYSTLIGDIPTGDWTAIESVCGAYGIDISAIGTTDTFGDLINLIGRILDLSFNTSTYPL